MSLWTYYHTPSTVDEALALLSAYQGRARVVAGGTDLLLDIRHGRAPRPEALVDITCVDELKTIVQEGDSLIIGAGVTHTQIVQNPIVTQHATSLVESCGVVGGPQVRNVGTLGGNVAHALPAGDGTTSLVALDADVEIAQGGVRRWVPILEMFKGPGVSLLNHSQDLLLRFRFPLSNTHEASGFKRIMRPQGVALPILGCAVWVRLDDSGERFEETRVCIGPVAQTPVRAAAVEAALRGALVHENTFEQARAAAQESLHPRGSKFRATADYRQEMIDVLLRRVLPLVAQRAQTGEVVPEGVGL